MDWAKAKNILIVVFLTLNIFLLAYGSMHRPQNVNSNEGVVSVLEILQKEALQSVKIMSCRNIIREHPC